MDQLIGRPLEAVDECCSTASISLAKSEDLAKQPSLRRLNMAPSKSAKFIITRVKKVEKSQNPTTFV